MYTNLTTKTQTLMGFKARSFTEIYALKTQSLPFTCFNLKPHMKFGLGISARPISVIGFYVNGSSSSREFSSMYSRKDDKGASGSVVKNGRALPWLVSARGGKDLKRTGRLSWGKKVEKNNEKKGDGGGDYVSSWEVAAERVVGKDNVVDGGSVERRMVGAVEDYRDGDVENGGGEGEEERESEGVEDPRWDRIKTRFRGGVDGRGGGYEKPEMRRWNKQESWGRKTWREATESSVPKMVGEGIYGVGPVLAALSAERREFYALYIQEGLDLSNNNRKKKDKKGFEKVLKMAEKIGLSIKEVSKHDLNMVADNRPHQGLVLDASPLEMVKMKELEPVTGDDRGSLWVALDEVTDPQNLGAIIRSAYFFGAAGIILCAKNSAPLSGVVSKSSAGSLELMELRYCKNMMQFLTLSAENGWRVLGGSVSSKAVPLTEVLPGEPSILVLGSEGTGLRPLVERSCTQLVRIPGNMPVDVIVDDMNSEGQTSGNSGEEFRSFLAVESLNVSVAAGVLLHHLTGDAFVKVDE